MNIRFVVLPAVIFFIVIQWSSAQDDAPKESIVAKAGTAVISEQEFIRRFEMLPGFQRQRRSQTESAKTEFLYTLIAEKLLAQEAVARRLDQDSAFQQSLLAIRKKLSRDELYRIEVSEKVSLSSAEIIQGMKRIRQMIFTEYLFFPNEADARFVRGLIRKSIDFESIHIDSSIVFLRDTATVIWGDADANLENAVYSLKKGEVSPVISAGGGFYIVKEIRSSTNPYCSGLSVQALEKQVIDDLRLRKERLRLDEYLSEALMDKKGFSVPDQFRRVARAFVSEFTGHGNEHDGLFSQDVIDGVRKKLQNSLYDTLVVVEQQYWSVDTVLQLLTNRIFHLTKSDSLKIPGIINTQIEILVQQELLEEIALQRGLDQHPSVKEKVDEWRDAMLASSMKNYIHAHSEVRDDEVLTFMKKTDDKVSLPMVQVRELKTKTLEEMRKAIEHIQEGMTFEEAVDRFSADSSVKTTHGLTGYFSIDEHAPIGSLAWKMNIGESFGPLPDGSGYLFFEVTGKKDVPVTADTAFTAAYRKAKIDLTNMRSKQTLNRLLAQSGNERGFVVFEDRLRQLKVTNIPMMTFRILGFGGRMFETPFVDPQVDWLNIAPPTSKVLP